MARNQADKNEEQQDRFHAESILPLDQRNASGFYAVLRIIVAAFSRCNLIAKSTDWVQDIAIMGTA